MTRSGRATVELSRIVGSAGKHDCFDEGLMPLRAVSCERWKRADKAFRLGLELPPVILYSLDGLYFVKDDHHRVSVALFHGAEWIDAEVTEFRSPGDQARPRPRTPRGPCNIARRVENSITYRCGIHTPTRRVRPEAPTLLLALGNRRNLSKYSIY